MPIDPAMGEPLGAATTWFLDEFVSPFVDHMKWKGKRAWAEYHDWHKAESAYREKLQKFYGQLRILGKPNEVALGDVFTDAYLLEEQTALRRFGKEHLHEIALERFREERQGERRNALALVKGDRNLYILGKPGAGKTTFLKNITIQAARHNVINRIPIFVSLHEWSNSPFGKDHEHQDASLLPFIVEQFDICGFPDAEPFIEYILKSGRAIVLFDGLDEVKQEEEQRRVLTRLLQNFARKYDQSQHLVTCRIAADEYRFSGFAHVEVADFTDEQVQDYARKWFRADESDNALGKQKYEDFVKELEKTENQGLRELCNSPLLLSMLCLDFDRTMRIPPNRIELYESALNALLSQWDAERSIQRDQIFYGKLAPRRKQQLFANIAAETFDESQYIFKQRWLEDKIVDYLARLPGAPAEADIDGAKVLNAIEAQHSIFVERAQGLYSFSHLTFHEYFTARYIAENEAGRRSTLLAHAHINDNRWREVFLLTASLLDEGDDFVTQMRQAVDTLLEGDQPLIRFFAWADEKRLAAKPDPEQQSSVRLVYLGLALDHARALDYYLNRTLHRTLDRSLAHAIDRSCAFASEIDRARALDRALAHSLDLALDHALAHAHDRTLTLILNVNADVGVDYGLLYSWRMASILRRLAARDRVDRYVSAYRAYWQELGKMVEKAKFLELSQRIRSLQSPAANTTQTEWQQFINAIEAIMQNRNLLQEWQLDEAQAYRLGNYFYANELLQRCLDMAAVKDRQVVRNSLFLPPR